VNYWTTQRVTSQKTIHFIDTAVRTSDSVDDKRSVGRRRYRGGRAIAQAVSRWLPTAAVQVRARVWLSGICGGQSGSGADFLRVLRFPLPISIVTITRGR
jgi:hypothetical protein